MRVGGEGRYKGEALIMNSGCFGLPGTPKYGQPICLPEPVEPWGR